MPPSTSDPAKLLVITVNSSRPYIFELPELLAHENGAPFRFRFRRRWLLKRDREKVTGLAVASNQCLIVFRDESTGRLVPLRYATLLSLTNVGDVVHFGVQLGEIVPLDLPDSTRTPQATDSVRAKKLETFQAAFEKAIEPQKNEAGKELEALVFLSNPNALKDMLTDGARDASGTSLSDPQVGYWESVFLELAKTADLAPVDFLRIIGLQEVRSKNRRLRIARDSAGTVAAYQVRTNRLYVLQLYQRRRKSREPAPLNPAPTSASQLRHVPANVAAVVDDAILPNNSQVATVAPLTTDSALPVSLRGPPTIYTLNPTQYVVGKYDVLEFYFRPLGDAAGQLCYLQLDLAGLLGAEVPGGARELLVPVQVGLRRRDIASTIGFLVLLMSLFLTEKLSSWTHVNIDILRALQTVGLFGLLGFFPQLPKNAALLFSRAARAP